MTRHNSPGRTAGAEQQWTQRACALFVVVALALLIAVLLTTRLSGWLVAAILAVGIAAALVFVATGAVVGVRVAVDSVITLGTGHLRSPARPVDHMNVSSSAEQQPGDDHQVPEPCSWLWPRRPASPATSQRWADSAPDDGPRRLDQGGPGQPHSVPTPQQGAQPALAAGGQLATAARPNVPEPQVISTAQLMAFDGGTTAGPLPWLLPSRLAQSGIAADSARIGDLDVRAASVIGPGHRCEEPAVERQDAYAIARTRSGDQLVVAVADGLSSSPFSELGARVAVSTAIRALCQQLDEGADPETVVAERLFNDVAGTMIGTGEARGIEPCALRSLLVVAVVPTAALPDGSRRVWTAQVGDVSLWLHGLPGWERSTGVAKSGMDRNVVEAALPFNAKEVITAVVTIPPGAGIAVMTDGLGDVLGDVSGAVDYFAQRWATPPHPAVFVADMCFDARGQTDDRTAVVVWCGQDARRAGA